MIRRLLPVFLLLVTFTFAAQAQKKTPEQKATKKAANITKFVNSKITAGAKVTAAQTAKVKEAYLTFYNDQKALRTRRKEFRTKLKAFKVKASKPVSKEEKVKLQAEQKELGAEKKAMSKERKEMVTRREEAIIGALNTVQQGHFKAMRAEQAAKRKAKKSQK
ncbi:hypothetical protein BKI52_15115 [marine bacterium AO1-C]|nr:hypothetical protein BKI52_15115 [marine bacterium AO1-C]